MFSREGKTAFTSQLLDAPSATLLPFVSQLHHQKGPFRMCQPQARLGPGLHQGPGGETSDPEVVEEGTAGHLKEKRPWPPSQPQLPAPAASPELPCHELKTLNSHPPCPCSILWNLFLGAQPGWHPRHQVSLCRSEVCPECKKQVRPVMGVVGS